MERLRVDCTAGSSTSLDFFRGAFRCLLAGTARKDRVVLRSGGAHGGWFLSVPRTHASTLMKDGSREYGMQAAHHANGELPVLKAHGAAATVALAAHPIDVAHAEQPTAVERHAPFGVILPLRPCHVHTLFVDIERLGVDHLVILIGRTVRALPGVVRFVRRRRVIEGHQRADHFSSKGSSMAHRQGSSGSSRACDQLLPSHPALY